MNYNFRTATSQHGHGKDELLSALQKYIRRGELEKATYVAIELERFSELPEARPLVTNFVNRLRVILGEETACGLTQPAAVVVFNKFFEAFDLNRDIARVRQPSVINIVRLLSAMKKQRLVSDIKALYFVPEAETYAFQSSHDDLKLLFAGRAAMLAAIDVTNYKLLADDDATVLQPIVNGIVSAIKRKSMDGFYWLDKLVRANDAFVVVGARRGPTGGAAKRHPMLILFEICTKYAEYGAGLWDNKAPLQSMEQSTKLRQVMNVCYNYFMHFGVKPSGTAKSHRDWIIFTIWPLLYCVRDVDFSHNSSLMPHWVTANEAARIYAEQLAAPPMVFDDYVFDQHTTVGRSLKRKGDFFAEVAAVVENVDETLSNPTHRKLYENFKRFQATGSDEIKTTKK